MNKKEIRESQKNYIEFTEHYKTDYESDNSDDSDSDISNDE